MPTPTEATDQVATTIRVVRDASLALLRIVGRTETTRGRTPMTITRGEIGGIQMAYNTPFTPRPSTSELARYFLAQTGRRPMLPYALDIWDGSQKKLAVSWGHEDGDLELMTLERGPWIDRLLEFAARLSDEVNDVR